MKKVLVVIVTYNGMRWLARCLDSVAGKADVFAVDNDSTDGSADFVQSRCPGAHLVRSAENLGFTAANNLGFERALEKGYDYVYLMNQDAWLQEDTLDTLVCAAERNPAYAVLSPVQTTADPGALDPGFAKLFPSGKTGKVLEVKRVMAAHWLVRVQALREIGLFDTLFPLYGQDDNWCARARFLGWKVGIVPGARAVHDRAQRKEPLEKLVFRNYRMGALLRFAHPGIPLLASALWLPLFTLVKCIRWKSLLPLRTFPAVVKDIPQARALRSRTREARRARVHACKCGK